MSDYTELFTSFYNQFILRDLLSIVLPGFSIIMATLYSNFQTKILLNFFSGELSILIMFSIVGISYVLGIFLVFLADTTGIGSTFYTPTPTSMRKRTIRFHRTLSLAYQQKEMVFGNIRERYIIFMQTTGNMAWACEISFYITIFSYWIRSYASPQTNDFGYNPFALALLFPIFAVILLICHFHFKDSLEDWDKLIIDEIYR